MPAASTPSLSVVLLEHVIMVIWARAVAAQKSACSDTDELTEIVRILHVCARRAKAIGFEPGEFEMRRMAMRIQDLASPEPCNTCSNLK